MGRGVKPEPIISLRLRLRRRYLTGLVCRSGVRVRVSCVWMPILYPQRSDVAVLFVN